MANTKITSNVIADGAITESKLASGVGGVAGIVSSANATAITIDSSENVGIGTSSPASPLDVRGGNIYVDGGGSGGASQVILTTSASSGANFGQISNTGTRWSLGYGGSIGTVGTEVLTWNSSGNVGIGTSSPTAPLHVVGLVKAEGRFLPTSVTSAGVGDTSYGSISNGIWVNTISGTYGYLACAGNGVIRWTAGEVLITGSLSKSSGSFRIPHPLPSKVDTHDLVHSFVEAPQADNIYRGKVDLVNGSATVNIDTVAGMTEGTFVALNREVQCFTTNESNWDAVKGSVSGNILTIESQNSESTATISWLVIGERQDEHMYDTNWTDDDGKVIVEPLKTEEIPQINLENA